MKKTIPLPVLPAAATAEAEPELTARHKPKEFVMNPIRHIRRLAAVLAGLASALLGLTTAAPGALARSAPPSPPVWERKPIPLPSGHFVGPVHNTPVRIPVHTVVIGGMPGWQIALIAAGAALVAATVAVLVDRAWAAHQKTITAAA